MGQDTKGSVTITNRSRAALTISLPHDLCCSEGECFCTRELHGSLRYDGVEGTRHVHGGKKRIPKSYTLLALATLTGLPPSVVKSPDVVAHRAALKLDLLDPEQTAKQAEELEAQAKKDAAAKKQTAAFLEEKQKRKLAGDAADRAADDASARAAAENALRSQAESASPAKRSKTA